MVRTAMLLAVTTRSAYTIVSHERGPSLPPGLGARGRGGGYSTLVQPIKRYRYVTKYAQNKNTLLILNNRYLVCCCVANVRIDA